MRYFKPPLCIACTYRVTNEEICRWMNHHINGYRDVLTTIKKRILIWYGHITRLDVLSKIIVKGGRWSGAKERDCLTISSNRPAKVLSRARRLPMIGSSGGFLLGRSPCSALTTQADYRTRKGKCISWIFVFLFFQKRV